jgi:hypothetical protein
MQDDDPVGIHSGERWVGNLFEGERASTWGGGGMF